MTTIATGEETQNALARTPKELVPLIKEQVQLGDLAAEEAGMPYYRKAGGLLEEARIGVKVAEEETFEEYCERITGKSMRTCKRWIQAYQEEVAAIKSARKKGKEGRARPSGLSNSLRDVEGTSQAGQYRPYRDWTAPVDSLVETARRQQAKAAEDRAAEQKRTQELARKLIDIGFKVLAKELHPDKMGGSKDAMTRLNKVRNRLMDVYG